MSIQNIFESLIFHFEQTLTAGKRNSYIPILKNAFMPYILNTHPTIKSADILFTHEITREDILNAGVFYIENTKKVISVSAIEKFLTAVGMFTKSEILVHYPQSTLALIPNFRELYPDVLKRCHKSLKDPLPHICLCQEEYKKVVDYFKTVRNLSYNQAIVKICVQLMLLYGFKLETMVAFKPTDMIEDRHILRRSIPNQDYSFLLDIPYSLATEIIYVKHSCAAPANQLLHFENGQPLSSSLLNSELREIGKKLV